MKRIKLVLAMMAVVIGTGMAFATAGNVQQPKYYNDAPAGQADHWIPIPQGETVTCNNAVRNCTADANMNVLQTGFGTLSN
jgi:hypothetical protein